MGNLLKCCACIKNTIDPLNDKDENSPTITHNTLGSSVFIEVVSYVSDKET